MMIMKKKKMRRSNGNDYHDDEYMVVEILSRLPVKSLLRFKCVSKRWCSLIQDPYFVDLHSARSMTRPSATFFISSDYRGRNITFFGSTRYDGPHFYFVDYVSFIGDPARRFVKFGPHYFPSYYNFIGIEKLTYTQILNGLLFMSFNEETVWILNPSTRQTILLTKTNIKEEENDQQNINNNKDVGYLLYPAGWGDYRHQYHWMNKEAFVTPKYGFGFDPLTKKYKVVCICLVDIWYIPPQLFLYHPHHDDHEFQPALLNTYYRCMVLTIDDDCCWRRIDDQLPPYHIHDGGDPVYLNGALYWRNMNSCGDKGPIVEVIVAFDISSEKFSVITIPDFVLKPERPRFQYRQQLYEVDGCLAMLENTNNNAAAAAASRPNTIEIWKLVVLPPPPPPDATTAACCWIKETILTLSFNWRKEGYLFEVIGTDQILLKRYNSKHGGTSFCYYDRDNNDDAENKNTKKKEKIKKTSCEMLEFTGDSVSVLHLQ